MQYQSAEMMDAVIKVLIAQNATVTDKNGNVIDTTADDFTYTPSTDEWKAGEQEITVTYNGNEDYLSSSATTTITGLPFTNMFSTAYPLSGVTLTV